MSLRRAVVVLLSGLASSSCTDTGVPEPVLHLRYTALIGGQAYTFQDFALNPDHSSVMWRNDDPSFDTYQKVFSPTWVSSQMVAGQKVGLTFSLHGGPWLGVGPAAFVFEAESGFREDSATNSVAVFVDRIRPLDGLRASAEFSGTLRSSPSTTEGYPRVEGTFAIPTDCERSTLLCGNTPTADVSAATKQGQKVTGEFKVPFEDGACPPEVARVFLDGAGWTFDGKAFRSGAAQPLTCRRHGLSRIVCAASQTGVSAEGCTWAIDAWSTPTDELWVFATADAACSRAAGRHCRTGYH